MKQTAAFVMSFLLLILASSCSRTITGVVLVNGHKHATTKVVHPRKEAISRLPIIPVIARNEAISTIKPLPVFSIQVVKNAEPLFVSASYHPLVVEEGVFSKNNHSIKKEHKVLNKKGEVTEQTKTDASKWHWTLKVAMILSGMLLLFFLLTLIPAVATAVFMYTSGAAFILIDALAISIFGIAALIHIIRNKEIYNGLGWALMCAFAPVIILFIAMIGFLLSGGY